MRFKARWYREHVDESFDPSSVTKSASAQAQPVVEEPSDSGSRGARTGGASESSATIPPPSASSSPGFPAYPASVPAPPPATVSVALFVLLANVLVVLGTLVSLFPIVPGRLRGPAFFAATQLSSLVGVNALLAKHGKPSFSTFKPWMDRVKDSEELFRVLLGMILSGNPSLAFGSVVGAVASARDAIAIASALATGPPAGVPDARPQFVRTLATKFGPIVRRLETLTRSYDAQSRLAQATGAITTSVMALLTAPASGIRSLGTAWVLWNQLRVRTKAADTGIYYTTVWKAMNEKFGSVLRRISVVDKVLTWGQGWFSRA